MDAGDFRDLHELERTFWWFVGMRDVQGALLAPSLPDGVDRVVLDAGCGTGANLHWLDRHRGATGAVVGLDLDGDALGWCRSDGHERLVQASATDVPFPDDTFDLVTSFDVIVQIPDAAGGGDAALHELARVLKPGGIGFVRAAAYPWMRSHHDVALHSMRRYTLPQLVAAAERAGLRVVRRSYSTTFLFPLAVVHRKVLGRFTRAGDDPASDVEPLPRALAWLNAPFTWLLRLEAWIIRRGGRLPFGLSTNVVVEKPR
jgi:ubiquinone/menaquinone biosynthesis C-methylase UbiE